MVEEAVWVEKEYVRPRLSSDEVWLIYCLIDNRYWLLRRNPNPLWDLEKVNRLRRKILRLVNRCRAPKYQISLRQRLYWRPQGLGVVSWDAAAYTNYMMTMDWCSGGVKRWTVRADTRQRNIHFQSPGRKPRRPLLSDMPSCDDDVENGTP